MSNKLIITHYQERLVSALYNEKDMIQVNFEENEGRCFLGNIYIGKVQNIVKNINAAFVEIIPGVMCYLSLDDAINPIFTKWNNNSTKVKVGDELIVQVAKEAVKTKAPVVTSNFNLTGKYVALVYGRSNIGISAKIQSEEIRSNLRNVLLPYKNEEYGFVIRTNAQTTDTESIADEVEGLIQKYERIKKIGVHRTRFTLLHQTERNYICDIRDNRSDSISEIITDDKEVYDVVKDYLETYQTEDLGKLRFYEDKLISLANLYSMSSRIDTALKSHVWLKSGASLVIQPTEALTVIDVNTEKAIAGRKNAQETFFRINMEAAVEIAKQIRLRNVSGIIIVDFIDMIEEEKKQLLMKELERLLRKDPVKTVLVDMTALGLVEITRKKVRRPLHEQIREKVL